MNSRARVVAVAMAVVLACLEPGLFDPQFAEGWWVFHIDGDRFADHVEVLRVDVLSYGDWHLHLSEAPSLDGAGLVVSDLASVTAQGRVSRYHHADWDMAMPSGAIAKLTYEVVADTASGTFTARDSTGSEHTYRVWGVRIDPAILGDGLRTVAIRQRDSTPVVLIRVDDAFATDRDFVKRLMARGLTAELAIPTGWMGGPDRVTWSELRGWAAAGFSVVAHSRWHRYLRTDVRGPGFIGEIIGSRIDLHRHGFPTRVFVQPGIWRDSLYFNGAAKLHTWRGAALRTFFDVEEAYAYPGSLPTMQSDMAMGLGHLTVSNGATRDSILAGWALARQPGRFTVFLVHSFTLPSPNALDWFLDSLAAARNAGAIRLVASSSEMFTSVPLACLTCSAPLDVTRHP